MYILNYLLTLLFVSLNNTFLSLFCCAVLHCRRPVAHVFIFTALVPALLIPIDLLGIAEIGIGNPLRTFLSMGIMVLSTHLCIKGAFTWKMLVLALGIILETCVQSVVALPMALNGFVEYTGTHMEMDAPFLVMQACTCFSNAAVLLLSSNLINKRKNQPTPSSFRLLSLFLVTQALLLNEFTIKSYSDHAFGALFEWFLLVFFCISADLAIFYVMNEIDKKIALQEEARFYQTQLSMQLELYNSFSAYSTSLRQIKQETAQNLSQAQFYLRSGEYKVMQQILTPLWDQVSHLRTVFYCENNIVNALLFIKHREMEQHGISFEYQVKLGNDCFAEKSDLCRILANLLDNAIEACQTISLQQKETSENRWNRNNLKIRLTCMPLKNMLFIQTENPFIGSLSFRKNGLPFSVKKDPTHGRGLAGLKKIADKYKGTVRFETNRSGRCIVTVTLLNLFES